MSASLRILLRRLAVGGAALVVLLCAGSSVRAQDEAALWAELARGGHYLLIRHALAPGAGDPAGFRLEDCATQRNLSEEGRTQARRIGELLRRHHVPVERVLSSPWCRCLETATLMDMGDVETWSALNNLYGRQENAPAQTAQVRARMSGPVPRGVVVLVTHGSLISALTGRGAGSGELVIVTPRGDGDFAVHGQISTR